MSDGQCDRLSDPLCLVATSPRLPPGLLSWAGWQALRSGPVYTADRDSPVALAVRAAQIEVTELAAPTAAEFRDRARGGRRAVWLVGPDGEPDFVRAVGDLVAREAGTAELEVVYGSWDPPGARLLDVVAIMDRLRSPGGCPWDAEQTHDSLRRYLLEEAYEAYDALLDDDPEALREELGDVLLQVAFHARLAEEDPEQPWGIDDVAGDLVAKLVRRHPHVFVGRTAAISVGTAADIAADIAVSWEQIKRVEKGRTSVTDGLARSQPALSLAGSLIRRARRAALPVPEPPAGAAGPPDEAGLGELLLGVVAAAEEEGLDPEAALRAAADRYSAMLRRAETAQAQVGSEP